MVVIQPGLEVDHPHMFNAEIKNEWSYTFLAWTGTTSPLPCTCSVP